MPNFLVYTIFLYTQCFCLIVGIFELFIPQWEFQIFFQIFLQIVFKAITSFYQMYTY